MAVKSKWKVQCNPIGGKYLYIAYRILDESKPVHSGNIEHYGEYSENEEEVQKLVDELNAKESKERIFELHFRSYQKINKL